MQQELLDRVIFSPGQLAIGLADGLVDLGADVTMFCPGRVQTKAQLVTADLAGFELELAARGDSYLELLKKHPLVFISLARQVQSEIVARAFEMANRSELDVVHVYTNEEDLALAFAPLCSKPVVFTHHDPFSFLAKYRNVFPKYAQANWISLSTAQREGMPEDTHWVANIPNGLDPERLKPLARPSREYVAYLGRIVEPKGVHLAIAAVREYNRHAQRKLALRIAGKHYGSSHDSYFAKVIEPEIDHEEVFFDGYVAPGEKLQNWLGNAAALLVPSVFQEPFGMVVIEALACGVPVVALDSGALGELVRSGVTGFIVKKHLKFVIDEKSRRRQSVVDNEMTAHELAGGLAKIGEIDPKACRRDFEGRFTVERMAREHLALYATLS